MSISGGDIGNRSSSAEDTSGLPNHYAALGLNEDASDDEVKRAYFRLVREFRPQEFPEEFQRFNDATAVLSDPRRRGAYDQTRRNGPRIQVLVDQAATAQDTDPQKAITLLKNAIALAPDVPRPRLLLATVLMRIHEYAAAEKQYRWLVKYNPQDDILRSKLARSLLRQGKQEEAEAALEATLRINARYHEAQMVLARLREQQERYAEAVELLERAIANDEKEDYADAEALIRLLVIHLTVSNKEEADRTSSRLVAILPRDDAERTGKVVRRILLRANELFYAEKYPMARYLLTVASGPAEGDEELTSQISTLLQVIRLREEARHMQADALVTGPLKTYLELRYLEKTPGAARQQTDVILTALQRELATDPRSLVALIDYLRREYPTISGEQTRLFAELEDRATKRVELNATDTRKTMAMPESEPAMPTSPAPPARKGFFGWRRGGK